MNYYLIIGWIACFCLAIMAYLFYQGSLIKDSDLKHYSGIIAKAPKITKDEYKTYNTEMRFFLEGEEQAVVVPGKLLNRADPAILTLEKGTEVFFFEKKEKAQNFIDGVRRLAFGLRTDEQTFYTKEEALAFYQSKGMKNWSYAFGFLGMVILFFLLKYHFAA